MMGRGGGGLWSRSKLAAASCLALSACASGPARRPFDLTAASPPQARAVRAQFRIGQATATADLDSDHILVRDAQTLATLAGARWPEPLPALFRARLAESFQNAGLARSIDGPAANSNYEIDLDIRAFELDAQTKEVSVDIAAWIVALGSGRIVANQIFTLRIPVASTDPANVAAAMDQAASTVMTEIVAFVDRKLCGDAELRLSSLRPGRTRRFPRVKRLGLCHVGLRQLMACGQVVSLDPRAGRGNRRRQFLGSGPRNDRIVHPRQNQHRYAGKVGFRRLSQRGHRAQQDGAGQRVRMQQRMAAAMFAPFE